MALSVSRRRFEFGRDRAGYPPDHAVRDVDAGDYHQGILRIQKYRHRHGGEQEYEDVALPSGADGFEARVFDLADHEDRECDDQGHESVGIVVGRPFAIRTERRGCKMHYRGNQAAGGRYR